MGNLDMFDGPSSLASIIDSSATPSGSRLLRKWICFPFNSGVEDEAETIAKIKARQ